MNLFWTRGITKELRAIRLELARLANCWERELADQGTYMQPPKADTSGPPPEILYTDPELDMLREFEEQMGKRTKTEEE